MAAMEHILATDRVDHKAIHHKLGMAAHRQDMVVLQLAMVVLRQVMELATVLGMQRLAMEQGVMVLLVVATMHIPKAANLDMMHTARGTMHIRRDVLPQLVMEDALVGMRMAREHLALATTHGMVVEKALATMHFPRDVMRMPKAVHLDTMDIAKVVQLATMLIRKAMHIPKVHNVARVVALLVLCHPRRQSDREVDRRCEMQLKTRASRLRKQSPANLWTATKELSATIDLRG